MKFLVVLLLILLPLNLADVDPADYIIVIISFIMLAFAPKTYTLNDLDGSAKMLLFMFALSFIASILQGSDPRFVALIILNALLLFICYFCIFNSHFRIDMLFIISCFFVFGNILFFMLEFIGVRIENSFEIFRNGRFMGTFGDPNFSGFCAVISFIYFLDRILNANKLTVGWIFIFVLITLSLVILLLSESRAAWAAGIMGLLAYFSVFSAERIKFVVPVLLITFSGFLTLTIGDQVGNGEIGALNERIRTLFAQSDSAEVERFQFFYARAALDVGLVHPLGIGPGMTSTYTGIVNAEGLPIGAHNSFIQIFTELGWLAFFSLAMILGIAIVRLYPRALANQIFGNTSCRVIFALMTGQIVFAMAHDMIAWRVSWLIPAVSICAAFAKEVRIIGSRPNGSEKVSVSAGIGVVEPSPGIFTNRG